MNNVIRNFNGFPFAIDIKNILNDNTLYIDVKVCSIWLFYIKVFSNKDKSNLIYEFEFDKYHQQINWDKSFYSQELSASQKENILNSILSFPLFAFQKENENQTQI